MSPANTWLEGLGAVPLAAWLFLLAFRGGFWRIREPEPDPEPPVWPSVTAVIPARDEAAVIRPTVSALLAQDYPGSLGIILVDDASTDGTADAARGPNPGSGRLAIIGADPLPPGWTGKLWALQCGLAAAPTSDYFLLTDADIVHAPDNLRLLVARSEARRLDLTSLMVRLRCQDWAERCLIPAFVFFFFKLYPPAWIADPSRSTAGAAGGCILIRRSALDRIGGIPSIRSELIDDCALARRVKAGGPIWLGVTATTRSVRAYPEFVDIWRMIARTAFTQLDHSAWLLAGTVAGMTMLYVAPPAGRRRIADRPPGLATDGRGVPADGPLLPAVSALVAGATCDCTVLCGGNRRIGGRVLAGERRLLERKSAGSQTAGVGAAGMGTSFAERQSRSRS